MLCAMHVVRLELRTRLLDSVQDTEETALDDAALARMSSMSKNGCPEKREQEGCRCFIEVDLEAILERQPSPPPSELFFSLPTSMRVRSNSNQKIDRREAEAKWRECAVIDPLLALRGSEHRTRRPPFWKLLLHNQHSSTLTSTSIFISLLPGLVRPPHRSDNTKALPRLYLTKSSSIAPPNSAAAAFARTAHG